MTRWTQFYDELAGPRYPALRAYAGLLTDDSTAADALVASALKRTFVRPRRLGELAQVEHQVRRAIVTVFLARAHEFEAKAPPVEGPGQGRTVDPPPEATSAPEPADADAPNPYAPPAPVSPGEAPLADNAAASNPEPPSHPAGPSLTPVSAQQDDPARASAGGDEPAHETQPAQSDEDRLRAALLALGPRSRAVALLHHHDALTPGQISERLGVSLDSVRSSLQDVRRVARTRLGIELGEPAYATEEHARSEVIVADHAGRA